ncbi:hypothetical protein Ami103574_02615 [Aminipila butyrica]|uniref:Uncharacterized protein n=1 Tax=Aminipila butyrica TaxID=433296 RepID=A0A858BSE7_9FIRM|nr:hypothetical protein [Aminipila butyrica]QIB68272.1 hypothetical protein Ami103574_02615 [Aminipila butyrica]
MGQYKSKYTGIRIDHILENAENMTHFTIKDIYPTLAALRAAYPTGNEYVYQVEEDRNVYLWSGIENDWVSLGGIGNGDMLKSVYDTNGNGVVDDAERLGGELPSYYDNKSISYAGSLVDITGTQTFDYLDAIIEGNTVVTPVNSSNPVSPDNPQAITSVGGENLIGNDSDTYYPVALYAGQTLTVSRTNATQQANINFYNEIGGARVDFRTLAVGSASRTFVMDFGAKFVKIDANFGTGAKLQVGSVATPYVPYRSFMVSKRGKNLLNMPTHVSFTAGASGYQTFPVTNFSLMPGNMTAICDKNFGGNSKIWMYDKSNTLVVNNVLPTTINMTEEMVKNINRISIVVEGLTSGTVYTGDIHPQLELGSTATPYEPYQGRDYTVQLKDTAGNLLEPMLKLPDGTVDKVFKDTDGLWKVRRYVGKKILNGSAGEAWSVLTTSTGKNRFLLTGFNGLVPEVLPNTSANIISNLLPRQSRTNISNGVNGISTGGSVSAPDMALYYEPISSYTVAQLRTWLQSSSIEVTYELATPTTETLHPDTQAVLNDLSKPLNGRTIIYGTDAVVPSFDVKHYKGVKGLESVKSAYQAAVEGGYVGTEADFSVILATAQAQIGILSYLTTTEKGSLVGAVNEIDAALSTHTTDLITDADGAHGFKQEVISFTPTILGTTTAGMPTYTSQYGRAVRQGKLVNFVAQVQISNKGGMTGNLRLAGLPIASIATLANGLPIERIENWTKPANLLFLTPTINSGTTIEFRYSTATLLAALQASDVSDTFGIRLSGQYEIA